MTALRWIARLIFLVALMTWLSAVLKVERQPESWAAARRRTAAFLVMVGAGVASIALAKRPETAGEETY